MVRHMTLGKTSLACWSTANAGERSKTENNRKQQTPREIWGFVVLKGVIIVIILSVYVLNIFYREES